MKKHIPSTAKGRSLCGKPLHNLAYVIPADAAPELFEDLCSACLKNQPVVTAILVHEENLVEYYVCKTLLPEFAPSPVYSFCVLQMPDARAPSPNFRKYVWRFSIVDRLSTFVRASTPMLQILTTKLKALGYP